MNVFAVDHMKITNKNKRLEHDKNIRQLVNFRLEASNKSFFFNFFSNCNLL